VAADYRGEFAAYCDSAFRQHAPRFMRAVSVQRQADAYLNAAASTFRGTTREILPSTTGTASRLRQGYDGQGRTEGQNNERKIQKA
jgi:hypothetical protein